MTARVLACCGAMLALAAGCGSSAPPVPLRVVVTAGGLTDDVATAVPVGPDRALTVAHVLAGARSVRVGSRPARVLRVDRRLDLALLEVRGLKAPPYRSGAAADVASIHLLRDGRPQVLKARVLRHVTATLEDAESGRTEVRPALELAAAVLPGDSGAPVTDADGRIVGVVFARGLGRSATAWAVDLSTTTSMLERPTP